MAVLKITLTFALIIYLLRRKVGLGQVMLLSSLFLGILFGVHPLKIAQVTFDAVVSKSTINLMMALILIMFLENIMRRSGMLQQMLDSLKALVGDKRFVMAFMPAFIGLLPSPGGARFSCPMVDETSRASNFSAEDKSFINFWFRHIWEYILPLYPGILLAAQLTGMNISRVVLNQLPFSILALIIGFAFGFGRFKPERPKLSFGEGIFNSKLLLSSLWPILAILVLVLGFKLEISLSIGLILILLVIVKQYKAEAILKTLRDAFSINIVVLILGIMVFKDMLSASGAVKTLPEFFSNLGISQLLIISLLPFTIGILTGLTQAVVAISYPVLLGLTNSPSMFTLAFVAGFAGVMLSPVHLCLVLTVDYFKTTIANIYRKLIIGEGILIGLALLLALINN